MISASKINLSYGEKKIFEDVDVKFTPGNCYGLIGANGAGKSTFLKILSAETEPQSGSVHITKGQRMSVLKQDHFAFDEHTALKTVLMGDEELVRVMDEKDAIYEKSDFSDEDCVKAAELEALFAEMNAVYGTYFQVDPPARAAFAVKDLPLGVLVEIETIAVK